jgi:phage portal protein BeeE
VPLPELTAALKSVFASFRDSGEPVSIAKEIKASGVAFDAIQAEWYARNGYPRIASVFSGGMPAWSGESVSIQSALNHSVVWACNRIISETVGMLPLVMLQKKGDAKQVADNHPAYALLHDAPSEEMTAMGMRSTLTSHTVLGGNAYAQIIRRSGTGAAIELHPMQPE